MIISYAGRHQTDFLDNFLYEMGLIEKQDNTI